jgi:hypothetical protein
LCVGVESIFLIFSFVLRSLHVLFQAAGRRQDWAMKENGHSRRVGRFFL